MRLSTLFSRKPAVDPRLLGPWCRVDSEGETDQYESLEVEFLADGTLRRAMYDGKAWRVVELSYHVDGPVVVSRHRSASRETRMGYALEFDGMLRLDDASSCTWYAPGSRRDAAESEAGSTSTAKAS